MDTFHRVYDKYLERNSGISAFYFRQEQKSASKIEPKLKDHSFYQPRYASYKPAFCYSHLKDYQAYVPRTVQKAHSFNLELHYHRPGRTQPPTRTADGVGSYSRRRAQPSFR